jgi:hypothetical protein
MPYDVDAAEDWLDNWAAGVSAQAERAATLSRRVAALTGSAESPDGSIRVTVGSSGQLEKLELDDRELARRILAVMRRAQASLAEKVTAEVRDTVGADSETGRAVIHSFETRFPAGDFSVREEDADDGR